MLAEILTIGSKIIDRVFQDPQKKAEAQLELLRLQQAGEFKQIEAELAANLAQIDVNKVEAASTSKFVSWWRPAVGWTCVSGLAYSFLAQPLLTWGAAFFGKPAAPTIDTGTLLTLLFGLLGLGGMRTLEKIKGVART